MQLYVDHVKSENSVVFVRWCFSPHERKIILKGVDVTKGDVPHVLISVVAISDDGCQREESRQIRPITDMATYVSLRSSGRQVISAIYVGNLRDAKKFTKIYKRKSNGSIDYETSIYDRDEEPDSEKWIYNRFDYNLWATLEIEVDARSFAHKPFDWKLVNYFFEAPPIDQCQFRKRRFMAYPILAVFCLLIVPFRSALVLIQFGILLFFGMRAITWGAINPFGDHRATDVMNSFRLENSIFLTGKAGELQPWRWMFFPPLWGAIALISVYVGAIVKALLIVGAIICFFAMIFIPLLIWERYKDSEGYSVRMRVKSEANKQKANLAEKREREALKRNVDLLACELVPNDKIELATLPRQTVRLRFLDLKRRVCQPYTRGK